MKNNYNALVRKEIKSKDVRSQNVKFGANAYYSH